jgi:hypothetical protein
MLVPPAREPLALLHDALHPESGLLSPSARCAEPADATATDDLNSEHVGERDGRCAPNASGAVAHAWLRGITVKR